MCRTIIRQVPFIAGVIVIGFMVFAITSLWCSLSHPSSPDRYSPWGRGYISLDNTVRDLHPDYTPRWTPDGQRIVFTVGQGFHYREVSPHTPIPGEEVYLGSIYAARTGGGGFDLNQSQGETRRSLG